MFSSKYVCRMCKEPKCIWGPLCSSRYVHRYSEPSEHWCKHCTHMYVTCIKSIMHLMHKEKTYLNDNLDTGFCVSFTLHIFPPISNSLWSEFLNFVQKHPAFFILYFEMWFQMPIKVIFWLEMVKTSILVEVLCV